AACLAAELAQTAPERALLRTQLGRARELGDGVVELAGAGERLPVAGVAVRIVRIDREGRFVNAERRLVRAERVERFADLECRVCVVRLERERSAEGARGVGVLARRCIRATEPALDLEALGILLHQLGEERLRARLIAGHEQ